MTTVATLLGAGQANAIVILDTFDLDHNLTSDNTSQFVDGPITEIAGGERDVSYTETPDSTSIGATQGGRTISASEEILTLNVGDFLDDQTGTVNLTYDGNDDSTAFNSVSGLGSLDFTESGNNLGLKFRVFSPTPEAELSVELFSGTSSIDISNFSLNPANIDNGNSENLFFSFTSNTVDADDTFDPSGTFDFANITGAEVELSFPSPTFQSVGLEAFGATPTRNTPLDEPTPTAVPFEAESGMAFVAISGLIAYRKFRNRRQNKIDG